MASVSSTSSASESNQIYDSGFIQHDLDFDSQNILDGHRSQLINNHFDLSGLSQYTIQFPQIKSSKSSTNSNDIENISNDKNLQKLQFDCSFESGNIGEINYYKDFEYDIKIRGDTNNTKHCIWFYFRIRGGICGLKVVCHLTNYSKNKSLYSSGFTPIIRSKTRPIWIRLPSHQVSCFKCNRHKKNCFSFNYTFDRNDDEYFFAYSYPYTYSYLQKFLNDIEKLNLPFLKRELLARSVQQRRVDCLRIEEVDKNTKSIDVRPVVVFSSRVHPGETPCSFVCHGLIEFLISNNKLSIFIRRNLTILILPMLNPDGVFLGNYRSTSLGYDLNRHWQNPNFIQHPSICSLKYLLRQLDLNKNNKLDIYMDLHAHTNALNGFMYCNPSNYNNKNDYTTIFPRLLDLHCNEYLFSKTKFCDNPKKSGSARRSMEAVLSEHPLCYTFEVSFWKSKSKKLKYTYTQETYRNIGRCMIQVLNDIYKLKKNKRNDLNQYNLKNKKFMKGDKRNNNIKKKFKNDTKEKENNNNDNIPQ